MATGFLQVMVVTQMSIPLQNARIEIVDAETMEMLQNKTAYTNDEGQTENIELETIEKIFSLQEDNTALPYKNYTLTVDLDGFIQGKITGLQIFDGVKSMQYIDLLPRPLDYGNDFENQINVGEPEKLFVPAPNLKEGNERILQTVVIPEFIIVHLGAPTANATNVRVNFVDYIKSVASSEIYPTWPTQALRANILAQVSFALNRVFTEWYPSRGFNFNITSSPSYDQKYVHNRSTFETTDRIVEEIFNTYLTRPNRIDPFFAEYCDGKTVTCKGMSQWGSKADAERGMNALAILRKYYGNNILLRESDNIAPIPVSYPGTPLRQGSSGNNVRVIQAQLNRIADNYPAIKKVSVDGIFSAAMTESVKKFQSIFNLTQDGVIGKGTWYKISYIYVSVKKLAQLTSEGEAIQDGSYPGYVVQRGDTGINVMIIQFYLNQTAVYVNSIDGVNIDGVFGPAVENSVKQFQRFFNIAPDGKVGQITWNKMFDIFQSIKNGVEVPPQTPPQQDQYPGAPLRIGSSGANVTKIQNWLNGVGKVVTSIPFINVDGRYGPLTRDAVIAFQRRFNLTTDGVVGRVTWNKLYAEWQNLTAEGLI